MILFDFCDFFFLSGMERVDALFWEIQMIMVRTLIAVQPIMINDRHCFELYGFDVMIDQDLKPWLIEVQYAPPHVTISPSNFPLFLSGQCITFTYSQHKRRLFNENRNASRNAGCCGFGTGFNVLDILCTSVVSIVASRQVLAGDEEHVSGWDIVYDNGYIEIDPEQCGYSTFLGLLKSRLFLNAVFILSLIGIKQALQYRRLKKGEAG